jgi:hypothetical protein
MTIQTSMPVSDCKLIVNRSASNGFMSTDRRRNFRTHSAFSVAAGTRTSLPVPTTPVILQVHGVRAMGRVASKAVHSWHPE